MHDFRSSLLSLLEKMLRQRSYWKHLVKGYQSDGLPDRVVALDRAIADLEYIINKSIGGLPPEFVAEVHSVVAVKNAERYARKQQQYADYATMAGGNVE